MNRTLLILLLVACTKDVQVREQTHEQIDNRQQTNVEQHSEEDKDKTTTTVKSSGPVKVDDKKTFEVFGWAPPPPGEPNEKPQWLPVKRVIDEKHVESAGTTTQKQIGEQQHETAEASGQKVVIGKKVLSSKKDDETKSGIFNFSLSIKLAILAGVIALLIGITALVNPNLLGIPARAVKWIIARFSKGKAEQ